ncbi:ABC transporter permease [Permianibacter sp. IMCC34836]|uniref:ABC transporter permease n=1 Tax=Permianibacter fluminis TaxID=2738515 RepID=UPI0015567879|nr:ABC transporter permease [Permianibacter fluminis]NQD38723.1 ABC transporter permease [Permianibacter fluminis]
MIALLGRQILALLITALGVVLGCYLLSHQVAGSIPASFAGFAQHLWQVLHGNFGVSSTGESVLRNFLSVLPASLELLISAIVLAVAVGIPAGVAAARRRNDWFDRLVGAFTLVGYSVPVFWWGLLLVLWFSLTLDWTPVSGRISFLFDVEPRTGFILIDTWLARDDYAFEAFIDALHHIVLPTLVLALLPMAIITRVTRTAMTEALATDYIRMARGQGIPEWRLVWVHALRNASQPVLAVLTLQFSTLITGLMLIESIFTWPGVGKWLLDALARGDYASVQAGGLLLALVLVVINFVMDLFSLWLNPLQRSGGHR